MELRQLQYFVTCADTKSFSKAALSLYTSQSNISKTIAALEKEVGQKLFDRRQYGIEMTDRGRQIYKYAISMLEYSEKILDNTETDYDDELRMSFQPCAWFAEAFCQYYMEEDNKRIRYNIISASVDEIIKRIANGVDQLGFIYVEKNQLKKLEDAFAINHIGHLTIYTTRNVLYCGRKTRDVSLDGLRLIQDCEDSYSGISSWNFKGIERGDNHNPKVVITTNSDYIMQEMLQKTELCNVGPLYNEDGQDIARGDALDFSNNKQAIYYTCIFKNDKAIEELPKHFLAFIRKYIEKTR